MLDPSVQIMLDNAETHTNAYKGFFDFEIAKLKSFFFTPQIAEKKPESDRADLEDFSNSRRKILILLTNLLVY